MNIEDIKIGDRIRLTGMVMHIYTDGSAEIRFDGAKPHSLNLILNTKFARAELLHLPEPTCSAEFAEAVVNVPLGLTDSMPTLRKE